MGQHVSGVTTQNDELGRAKVDDLEVERDGPTPSIDETDGSDEARGLKFFAEGRLAEASLVLAAVANNLSLDVLVGLAPIASGADGDARHLTDDQCRTVLGVVQGWGPDLAMSHALVLAKLCVVDGITSSHALLLLQGAREQMDERIPSLEAVLEFWDRTQQPLTSFRHLIATGAQLSEQFESARLEVAKAMKSCRAIHFHFSSGNRYVGRVFPPAGGRCPGLTTERIKAGARDTLRTRLRVLQRAVHEWKIAATAIRQAGAQDAGHMTSQLEKLQARVHQTRRARFPSSRFAKLNQWLEVWFVSSIAKELRTCT